MWQFVEAVEGIGATPAARSTIPITGGNVSLYNETDGQRDLSDAGHRRRRADRRRATRLTPRVPGRAATRSILLGESRGELGGSEYLKVVHGLVRGDAAGARSRARSARCSSCWSRRAADRPDALGARLLRRRARGDAGRMLLRHRRYRAAVDVPSPVAARCSLSVDAALFGESASRVVVSVAPATCSRVLARAAARGRAGARIGRDGRHTARDRGRRPDRHRLRGCGRRSDLGDGARAVLQDARGLA